MSNASEAAGNAGNPSKAELLERLTLMEEMIHQGRRSTERWGGVFVMWGLLPLAALLVSMRWPHPNVVWPAMMVLGGIATAMISSRHDAGRAAAHSAVHRALSSAWAAAGAAVFVYVVCAGFSHHFEMRSFLAMLFLFLAIPNAVSAAVLRWNTQFAVAAMWAAAAVLIFFAPETWQFAIYVAAILLGNVVFGVYLMIIERRAPQGSFARA